MNKTRIVLATGNMSVPEWRTSLTRAFTQAGFDFDLQEWNGQPTGAPGCPP